MTTSRLRWARALVASAPLLLPLAHQTRAAPTQLSQHPAAASPSETSPGDSGGPIVRQDATGNVVAPTRPHSYAVTAGEVTLNYVDTDVKEIARVVLGEILKVNYSIDPGLSGTVTIQTARPLKRDELLPTLQSLLTQAGLQITYQNDMFRISSLSNDQDVPPVVGRSSFEAGSQVVALRYASAKQLAAMLQPYVADGAKIMADPSRNVLVVTGAATPRQNVIDLIRIFDVDYLAGQSYALFPVKFGDPEKLATDVENALQANAEGALSGAVRVVPLDEANAIMVIARSPKLLDRVERIMRHLDQVKAHAGRTIHVYYLKNTQATDLQPILQRAINPPGQGGGGEEEIAPGNLPPTSQGAQLGASLMNLQPGGAQQPGSGQNGQASQAMQAPAQQQPQNGANGPLSGQVSGGAKGPRIIADNRDNALVVVCSDAEFGEIENAIRKLDVLPMEVLVEATIAEVTLNKDLSYGTQWFLQGKQASGLLSNAQSPSPTVVSPGSSLTNAQLFQGLLAPSLPGLAVTRTFGDAQFALQMLKTVTDVKLISAPKLLILNNQSASIQVGDLVPIITQSATNVVTSNAAIVNNIQYQPTGVILTVTPRVNSGGLVTLDLQQEVSDVVPTTSSTINSPTFQQRRVATKVVVQDGETISLAGLISDKKTKSNSGIPFLQELPVLGPLFGTRDNNDDRTELLVLLTPRVVRDQHDARALTDELRAKLAPSQLVP